MLVVWGLEIGLLLLSVAALLAILLTLWSQDGKVSQFPSGITLNSLVSVLTVILRLALVFVLLESKLPRRNPYNNLSTNLS